MPTFENANENCNQPMNTPKEKGAPRQEGAPENSVATPSPTTADCQGGTSLVPLSVINDRRLSFEAIGVYGCICCLEQTGRQATIETLMRMSPVDPPEVIMAALDELVACGHITMTDIEGGSQ